MLYRVKKIDGTVHNLSLGEINRLLRRGWLTGREVAWQAGFLDWKRITDIEGVVALQGVKGWLFFFCVFFAVLSPLWAARILAMTWHYARLGFFYDPAVKFAALYEHAWLGLITMLGAYCSYVIWRGYAMGALLAKTYIAVRLFGFLLSFFVVQWIVNISDVHLQDRIFRASLGMLMREGALFLVWWLYFKRSIRVQNTYSD